VHSLVDEFLGLSDSTATPRSDPSPLPYVKEQEREREREQRQLVKRRSNLATVTKAIDASMASPVPYPTFPMTGTSSHTLSASITPSSDTLEDSAYPALETLHTLDSGGERGVRVSVGVAGVDGEERVERERSTSVGQSTTLTLSLSPVGSPVVDWTPKTAGGTSGTFPGEYRVLTE
ncbi:hypothetical protein KIPB_009370, partial [Kipferlia bialata]